MTLSSKESASMPRGQWGRGLLASELGVLFRRRRTWAMMCALAAIPILIAVAVRLSSAVPPGRGPAFLDRITQNGLFVGVTAMLVSVPLFLPLTVGVVAGDTVAGEAGLGTLRYLLASESSCGIAGPTNNNAGKRRRCCTSRRGGLSAP